MGSTAKRKRNGGERDERGGGLGETGNEQGEEVGNTAKKKGGQRREKRGGGGARGKNERDPAPRDTAGGNTRTLARRRSRGSAEPSEGWTEPRGTRTDTRGRGLLQVPRGQRHRQPATIYCL